MPTPLEIFNKKDKFLETREAILNRRVSAAEKKLLSVIISQFVDELEKSGGVITNNGKNITLTQALEAIFREFDNTINKSIIEGYLDDISKGQALNGRYFGSFSESPTSFSIIKNRVTSTVNRRLGINKDGSIRKGGYLDSFINDSNVKTRVKDLVTRAITGGASISQTKSDLKTLLVGEGKAGGQLSSQYRTFINDTYQQVDNLESSLYAEELGLQAAFYAGGTIRTTRKFCCQRNGLIFTVDEIKKWKNLKFQGKNKNYNPLTDQGGYNCRHRFRYITNKIALRRRTDLKEDSNGRLVPREGQSTQKLNPCA